MIGFIANYLGAQTQGDTAAEAGGDARPQPVRHGRLPPLLTADDLVPRLVEAFRTGAVTDEQRRILHEHLVGDGAPSYEVKLDHLRNRVADLEAYADALEAFIDGEGTAREVLEALRADIEATDDALEALADRVDDVEDDQSAAWTELSRLHDAFSSLDDYVQDLDGRHSRELVRLDTKTDDIGDALDTVRSDVDRLDGQVAKTRARADALEVAVRSLGTLEPRVSAIEDDMAALDSIPRQVARLSKQAEAMESVPEEIAGLREDVDELESFRDEFAEAVSAD